ncbi:LPS assembly lipoprotein LptE [Sandaracinobacteroides sp. A072]|uniref:LPS assembly lipoprotein LptE n=1 Tax=Sandaracinobacteroides sp. A072 TaxID=3461146 RepID=UPI004041AF2D
MRHLAALLLLLAPLALAGCQLAPVYSGGSAGPAQALLGSIEVAPIPDRIGFLVHDRLVQRLQPAGSPRFRLDVALDDRIEGFGVRGDNSIIRERRTLRARYRLVDMTTGATLLDTTASADAGIDVVSSEYAVVAAETTAVERLSTDVADQIVARIALLGSTSPESAATAPPQGPE